MDKTFELYFSDLNEKAQREILKKAGVKKPEDMNWDIFPITIIELEGDTQ